MIRLADPDCSLTVAQALARDARRLHQGERCPIDVEQMADRLGLGLRVEPDAPALGGLYHGPAGKTVVVRGRGRDDVRARFTAAHEIGHHLLDMYGVGRPADRGEYWAMERLCNDFAGQLLVPDAAVDWTCEALTDGPGPLLRRARLVSERAAISRAVVSHRLGRVLVDVAFCEIELASPRRAGVSGVVRWVVERFPWLGRGQKTHLDTEHFLAPLLDYHVSTQVGCLTVGTIAGRAIASERRPGGVWIVCLDGLGPRRPHTRP